MDVILKSTYPTAKCKKPCIYMDDQWMCNYYLETGIMRPCPPGPDCTVYVEGKHVLPRSDDTNPRPQPRKILWDVEKAREMRNSGATYHEIAKALGVSRSTVEDYARKFWKEKLRNVEEQK